MSRIVIAEDQGMLRGALGSLLDFEDDLEVIAQAKNGNWIMTARNPLAE